MEIMAFMARPADYCILTVGSQEVAEYDPVNVVRRPPMILCRLFSRVIATELGVCIALHAAGTQRLQQRSDQLGDGGLDFRMDRSQLDPLLYVFDCLPLRSRRNDQHLQRSKSDGSPLKDTRSLD